MNVGINKTGNNIGIVAFCFFDDIDDIAIADFQGARINDPCNDIDNITGDFHGEPSQVTSCKPQARTFARSLWLVTCRMLSPPFTISDLRFTAFSPEAYGL
jgi:hypothetical protein